jgi:hypothetical protein
MPAVVSSSEYSLARAAKSSPCLALRVANQDVPGPDLGFGRELLGVLVVVSLDLVVGYRNGRDHHVFEVMPDEEVDLHVLLDVLDGDVVIGQSLLEPGVAPGHGLELGHAAFDLVGAHRDPVLFRILHNQGLLHQAVDRGVVERFLVALALGRLVGLKLLPLEVPRDLLHVLERDRAVVDHGRDFAHGDAVLGLVTGAAGRPQQRKTQQGEKEAFHRESFRGFRTVEHTVEPGVEEP